MTMFDICMNFTYFLYIYKPEINLRENNLKGTLPREFADGINSLLKLDLSKNKEIIGYDYFILYICVCLYHMCSIYSAFTSIAYKLSYSLSLVFFVVFLFISVKVSHLTSSLSLSLTPFPHSYLLSPPYHFFLYKQIQGAFLPVSEN